MKRKQIVALFLLFFFGIGVYVVANGENKDKLGAVIEDQKGRAIEVIKKNGSIALDETKEKASEVYEAVKEKGGEAIQSTIITPVQDLTQSVIRRVVVNAATILTPEDVEEILIKKEGKTTCECK